MKTNYSVSVKPYLTAESGLPYKHGMPPAIATYPVCLGKTSANLQPQYPIKPDSLAIVGLTPSAVLASSVKPVTAIDKEQASRKPTLLSDFLVLLQFLVKQVTSPLSVFFVGAVVLVVIAMFISQLSGGIKVKLDLEVSPVPNQVQKARAAK